MPKWYDLARKEIGTKEVPGKGDNPKVVRYYADAGFSGIKHDSVAWCAAFANAMLERSGVKGCNSLTARSFLKWGKKLDRPVEGCIVVFKRGNSSWQGHVAFFVKESNKYVTVLGGNQADAVNVRRYSKSKFLGYRWPEDYPMDAVGPAVAPEKKPTPKMLRMGDKGDHVKPMQTVLDVIVDGDFGKKTLAALRAYQQKHGLEVDGICGPQSFRHMGLL